jgi:hypothetical protein
MITPRRNSARLVLGGLLAASVLGAGAALALEHAGSAGNPVVSLLPAASSATATPTPTGKPHQGAGNRAPGGLGGLGGLGGFGLGAGQILGVITKDTGQTPMQIFTALQGGKTLRDIAGSNAQKVKDDVLASVKTSLDAAVTKNVITSAQEQTLLTAAGSAIDVALDAKLGNLGLGTPGSGLPFGGGFGGGHGHAGGAEPSESPEPGGSPKATPTPSV